MEPTQQQPPQTQVISLKKFELSKRGYKSFTDWARVPGHLYIGRKVNYPDVMAPESKWANPFKVDKYGRDECLRLYEEHVKKGKLYAELETLEGKELGCWCHPEPCHGHVLVRLLEEKKKKVTTTTPTPAPTGKTSTK